MNVSVSPTIIRNNGMQVTSDHNRVPNGGSPYTLYIHLTLVEIYLFRVYYYEIVDLAFGLISSE